MNEQDLFDVISARLKPLGYVVRQSPGDANCWYATKVDRGYLFALIRESDGWRINDISGNGLLEQPRIERELNKPCN